MAVEATKLSLIRVDFNIREFGEVGSVPRNPWRPLQLEALNRKGRQERKGNNSLYDRWVPSAFGAGPAQALEHIQPLFEH